MELQRSDIRVGEIIGKGGESTVHKGILFHPASKNMIRKVPVAIKKLLKTAECEELKNLTRCNHPNIIFIFGFLENVTELLIVMELCTIGSLRVFLEKQERPLQPNRLFDWVLQTALPLQYLHEEMGIVHKDVKTDNYVITSKMLTDFGISRDLNQTISRSASTSGTWRWMASERHDPACLSFSSDVFSLALVWWSLVARKLPYEQEKAPFMQAMAIRNGIRPSIPQHCPEGLSNLIIECWDKDRKMRPKINIVVGRIQTMLISLRSNGQNKNTGPRHQRRMGTTTSIAEVLIAPSLSQGVPVLHKPNEKKGSSPESEDKAANKSQVKRLRHVRQKNRSELKVKKSNKHGHRQKRKETVISPASLKDDEESVMSACSIRKERQKLPLSEKTRKRQQGQRARKKRIPGETIISESSIRQRAEKRIGEKMIMASSMSSSKREMMMEEEGGEVVVEEVKVVKEKEEEMKELKDETEEFDEKVIHTVHIINNVQIYTSIIMSPTSNREGPEVIEVSEDPESGDGNDVNGESSSSEWENNV